MEKVMQKRKGKNWILFLILTVIGVLAVYRTHLDCINRPDVFWRLLELEALLYLFLVLHCFIELKKLYDGIYRYRLWIAIGLFVFCTANCFTLSSVGMYNQYVQPNTLSEFSTPLLGTARFIRSDEWMVNISRIMAGSYNNYGAVNSIVRGTAASGISATGGLYFDYAALRSPSFYGYYLFGAEYGNSFFWSFLMIFGALLSFEFFMILTKGKKVYSVFGTALLWFSTFNLWWSICGLLFAFLGIVVFFYYMIHAADWKKRLLFGTMLAIAGADFCTLLYPAWQVPFGWLLVGLLAWILITCQNWKQYRWTDWLVIGLDVFFMATIILRFVQADSEYIQAVGATIYPGKRVSYGGYSLNKLLGYSQSAITSFFEVTNASEMSTFFGVFPLGIFTTIYVLWKEKGKNVLLWCLLVPTVFLFLYCSTGLPPFLAKVLMLTNSIPKRAVDILGIYFTVLTVVSLAEMEKCGHMKGIYAIVIAVICAALPFLIPVDEKLSGHIHYLIALQLVVALFLILLLTQKKKIVHQSLLIGASVLLVFDGMCINPLSVGLKAITEKPLYTEVRSILKSSNTETRWIAIDNLVTQNYLIACGAPTLNSTNYLPNYDMWKILDPENTYEDIWNRYAQVNINLVSGDTTSVTLVADDSIRIDLCRHDLLALHVDYILCTTQMPSGFEDVTEKIYEEDGSQIYKVIH